MERDARQRKQEILEKVSGILRDMTTDWDLDFSGGIGPETRLISDLAFESIDVVQFVVAIEEHYQRRDLPFESLLMVDGRYVDEIQVGDAVEFLDRHLNGGERASGDGR